MHIGSTNFRLVGDLTRKLPGYIRYPGKMHIQF